MIIDRKCRQVSENMKYLGTRKQQNSDNHFLVDTETPNKTKPRETKNKMRMSNPTEDGRDTSKLRARVRERTCKTPWTDTNRKALHGSPNNFMRVGLGPCDSWIKNTLLPNSSQNFPKQERHLQTINHAIEMFLAITCHR